MVGGRQLVVEHTLEVGLEPGSVGSGSPGLELMVEHLASGVDS